MVREGGWELARVIRRLLEPEGRPPAAAKVSLLLAGE